MRPRRRHYFLRALGEVVAVAALALIVVAVMVEVARSYLIT